MYENQAAGMSVQGYGQLGAELNKSEYVERLQKLTVRDNIDRQIEEAKAEVARLEGIRDRLAPELLDQRIVDLQQAMRF